MTHHALCAEGEATSIYRACEPEWDRWGQSRLLEPAELVIELSSLRNLFRSGARAQANSDVDFKFLLKLSTIYNDEGGDGLVLPRVICHLTTIYLHKLLQPCTKNTRQACNNP